MSTPTEITAQDIIVRMDRMEEKQNAIYGALIGNELMGEDGGMVARLKRVEQKADLIEQELSKYKAMFKGMWAALGIAFTAIIILLKQIGFLKL